MFVDLKSQRLSETNIMNNGQVATIIAYRNSLDIDVEFEDGTIERHKKYDDFTKGKIINTKFIANNKLGLIRTMNNGQLAKVISYRRYNDIDVKFEDGTVVKNKQFYAFMKGAIRNPNCTNHYCSNTIISRFSDCLGEAKIMDNGQTAKIIRLGDYGFVDIEFEDGTILKNKRYENFKMGSIRNPNFSKTMSKNRIGASLTMNNGQKATIVAYRNCKDITVEFEDGTIAPNKSYYSFIRGHISNPNYNLKNRENKIGEKRVMSCGIEGEIIAYRNANSIDVRFSNGTIAYNKQYKNFIKGWIHNPILPPPENTNKRDKRIGEKKCMTCGMEAEIISYRNRGSIDVRFEDGTVVYNRTYRNFALGYIGHPNIKSLKRGGKNDSHFKPDSI